MRSFFAALLIGLLLCSTSGLLSCSSQELPLREEGSFPEAFLGGGDYVMLRSPSGNAWVAVVYGSGWRAAGGPVSVMASWARSVGAAELHDSRGRIINTSLPLCVRTLVIHRLIGIYEFNDTDGDGLANVSRSALPLTPDQILAREMVYKAVSLWQDWTRGPVTEETEELGGEVVKSLSFNLTATGLGYAAIGNGGVGNDSLGDGLLNSVRLSFRLRVWTDRVEGELPFFNLSLDVNGTGVEVRPAGARIYNGTVVHASLKASICIEGWDPEPLNANPRLVVEWRTIVGSTLSTSAPQWMTVDLARRALNSTERAGYSSGAGVEVAADALSQLIPEAAPPDPAEVPSRAEARRVELACGRERVGNVTWASVAGVWASEGSEGSQDSAFVQIHGFRGFSAGTDRGLYTGLMVLGGVSYPCGWRVEHDPELGLEESWYEIPELGPPPNHAPTAMITSPPQGKVFKEGDVVRLDASGSFDPDGDRLFFIWMEGTRLVGNDTIVSRKFGPGTHRVSLTVHDGRGGFDSANVTFKVEKRETPGFGAGVALVTAMAAVVRWTLKRAAP
ncbi:MAG: PKD domain-containing protein [Thermoplasmata archaeon]